MYDELVKALRGCVISKPCDACPYYDPNGPTKECATMNIAAADAIEKLSMRIHGDEAAIVGMKREIERMVVADKPRWIPVTERLPEEKGNYLVVQDCGHGAEVHEAFFFKYFDSWEWYDPVEEYQKYNPSHWMSLPEPPKDGET